VVPFIALRDCRSGHFGAFFGKSSEVPFHQPLTQKTSFFPVKANQG
jgi:hypothetical protein